MRALRATGQGREDTSARARGRTSRLPARKSGADRAGRVRVAEAQERDRVAALELALVQRLPAHAVRAAKELLLLVPDQPAVVHGHEGAIGSARDRADRDV